MSETAKTAREWPGWDDAAIGAAVRKCALILTEGGDNRTLYAHAAALLLCQLAAEAGSDHTTIVENGVTSKGKPLGHFRVTVERSGTPFVTD